MTSKSKSSAHFFELDLNKIKTYWKAACSACCLGLACEQKIRL